VLVVERPVFATTFDKKVERVYFVEMVSDSRVESVELGVVSIRVRFVKSTSAEAVNRHSKVTMAVNCNQHRCGDNIVTE